MVSPWPRPLPLPPGKRTFDDVDVLGNDGGVQVWAGNTPEGLVEGDEGWVSLGEGANTPLIVTLEIRRGGGRGEDEGEGGRRWGG